MPPNMSFALTTKQVCDFEKNVTRRAGWWNRLKPGQLFWGVKKSMGLKRGEKIERVHLLQCIGTRAEPLARLIEDPEYGKREMVREGFPGMEPAEFITFFMQTHKGTSPESKVNRIAFRYYMDHLEPIKVPKKIATCPACKSQLIAEMDEWTQDERDGTWFADSPRLVCASEPEITARKSTQERYDDIHHEVDSMPYVYWLPVCETVEAWMKATFRFDLKE